MVSYQQLFFDQVKYPISQQIPTSESYTSETTQPTSGGAAFLLTLLYLAMVFFRPQEFMPSLEGVPLLPLTMAVALFAWLLSENKTIEAQQLYALTLLLGFTVLSVGLSGWIGGMIPAAGKLIPTYVLFLLIASTATTAKRQRLVMWVFIAGAAMMAVHGMQQKFTGIGWTGEVPILGRIRYIGIFNDPNDVGLVLVCSLPMVFYLLSCYRNALARLFFVIVIATILYGVVLTNSRGTTLATAVLAGLYLWRHQGVIKTVVFGAAIIPVILLMSTRIDTISASESSAHGRIEAWYEGFQMLKSNPFFGVGFERFTEHNPLTAHNSFVLAFAELGVFGYILWFSFVLSSVAMMLYLYNPSQPRKEESWEELVGQYSEEAADDDVFSYSDAEESSDKNNTAQAREISREDSSIANVLFYTFAGFSTSAFFLSRTYNVVLFVLCAMAASHYLGVRLRTPGLPSYGFFSRLGLWVTLSLVSIIALYIITKILMTIA